MGHADLVHDPMTGIGDAMRVINASLIPGSPDLIALRSAGSAAAQNTEMTSRLATLLRVLPDMPALQDLAPGGTRWSAIADSASAWRTFAQRPGPRPPQSEAGLLAPFETEATDVICELGAILAWISLAITNFGRRTPLQPGQMMPDADHLALGVVGDGFRVFAVAIVSLAGIALPAEDDFWALTPLCIPEAPYNRMGMELLLPALAAKPPASNPLAALTGNMASLMASIPAIAIDAAGECAAADWRARINGVYSASIFSKV